MFIRSICQISHQTNRFLDNAWKEDLLKDRLNFPDTVKFASRFAWWPPLCSTLSLLNDENFTNASDDYRTRLNHGFPRRIEFGHTLVVKRDLHDPNKVLYTFGNAPPLFISDLVPLLATQYNAALNCFDAYIALVKEQSEYWPKPSDG